MRSNVVFISAAACAALGFGASLLAESHSSAAPIRFAFATTRTFPMTPGSPDPEMADFATCQWPDGQRSITPAQAAARGCNILPAGRNWMLLASPIGGARVSLQNGQLSDDVRFVHADRRSGGIDVGPILMQFGDYSGGARPDVVDTGSTLWIFDPWTDRGAEVLRLSTTTGAVVQRTTMPAISRPTIAVTQQGLWIGQAGSSLFDRGQRLGVWFAQVGAAHGRLIRATDETVEQLASSGNSMDVDLTREVGANRWTDTYWRFTPIAN